MDEYSDQEYNKGQQAQYDKWLSMVSRELYELWENRAFGRNFDTESFKRILFDID